MSKKIAIIGGGNLGASIAEGLVNSKFIIPKHIIVTRRNIQALESLEEKGVLVSNDNKEAVEFAHVIILAVKPFQVQQVLDPIKDMLDEKKHIIVSVATGVSIKDIQSIINKKVGVVRAMP